MSVIISLLHAQAKNSASRLHAESAISTRSFQAGGMRLNTHEAAPLRRSPSLTLPEIDNIQILFSRAVTAARHAAAIS